MAQTYLERLTSAAALVHSYVESGGQDHEVIIADRLLTALLSEPTRLLDAPTEDEADLVGMDLMAEHRSIRARGMIHSISVFPNENKTGWIVGVESMSNMANLPQAQAEVLARLLLAGPGEDEREKCEHGKVKADWCRKCRTGEDPS